MRLFVIYDQVGEIVAAARLDYPALPPGVGPVLPVVKPGQSSAELELPAEHAHLTFAQACRQMMVDNTTGTARLLARPAGSPNPRSALSRNS